MLIENYSEKLRKAGYDIINKVEKRIGKYFFNCWDKNPMLFFGQKWQSVNPVSVIWILRRF